MPSNSGPGKLNVFQRAMLQWNDLHPYHAVHVLRFQGTPDLDRLRRAILSRLGLHGLHSLRLDRQAGTLQYGGDPLPVEIADVSTEGDPLPSLSAETERQLNRPFDISGRFVPFRFFVLRETDSFLLGTTYFHPIADAESVALLLRQLATDYITGRHPVAGSALDRHPPRHDRLLSSSSKVAARKLLALPSDIRTMRHSHRTPLHDTDDLGNRARFMLIDPQVLNRLLRTAKSWEITLHDLLLAMLMNALAPLAPERHGETRRRNLSLGTIVNVRRDCGIDSSHTFGLFLGSFVVTHPVPEGITLQQLAAELHLQTAWIKRQKLYLATPLELRLASRLIAMYSTPRQKKFYHKNHPLWGGITNMNLNQLWPRDEVRPMDYFRAVSTGPVTPLVLSVTTFDDHMNIGLTYRRAVFGEQDMDAVEATLSRQFTDEKLCA